MTARSAGTLSDQWHWSEQATPPALLLCLALQARYTYLTDIDRIRSLVGNYSKITNGSIPGQGESWCPDTYVLLMGTNAVGVCDAAVGVA